MESQIVLHILLGKFRPEITSTQLEEIIRRFSKMVTKIPGALSFQHGANNSPEGKNQGFTEVVIVTFQDAASRDAYLVHPEHIRFSTWLGKQDLVMDLVIVDFTPQTADH